MICQPFRLRFTTADGPAVESLEPQYGNVILSRRDGQRAQVSVRFLISHPGCRSLSRSAAAAAANGAASP